MYDSFVSAKEPDDRAHPDPKLLSHKIETKPIKGNTIFVSGYKISEEFLKKHFSTFGNILKINLEAEKK